MKAWRTRKSKSKHEANGKADKKASCKSKQDGKQVVRQKEKEVGERRKTRKIASKRNRRKSKQVASRNT